MGPSGVRRTLRAGWLPVLVAALVAAGTAAAAPATAATPTAMTAAGTAPAATAPAGAARPADPIAHDPTIAKEGDWYYVVITGDAGAPHTYLPIKRSKDLVHWTELGPVFSHLPAWVPQALGVTPPDAWGPDLSYADGHWSLYYAASQFGTENSVIGLATTPTLDPDSPAYGWVDRGLVLRSQTGDPYNAIDPNVSRDADGGTWLAYGSFFGGIALRRLDAATGKLSTTDPAVHALSTRVAPDAEEGPSIVRHGGYYYLFEAFDFCCRGVNSDYRVVVGRSTSITGPYVDQAGVPMLSGGGTEVLRGYNEFVGTGGADVLSVGGTDYFVNHYYDATDGGAPKLNVRTLSWSAGDWPSVSDPVNPSRSIGHGPAYVELVSRSSGEVVEDAGCGYEGANIALWTRLGNTCQQWQLVPRGSGDISIRNAFSNKVAEVAACHNVDGGNVAQWGWLGFLANNDCQRWAPVPAGGGYTTFRSILPGARVWDVAACGTTPGTNIDVTTATGTACQQFRVAPVGDVLLASPADGTQTLGVSGCPGAVSTSAVPVLQSRLPQGCQVWRFRSIAGAEYAVTNVATGRELATSRCTSDDPAKGTLRLRHAQAAPPACSRWTAVPAADGTWALTNVGTGIAQTFRLLLP